MIKDFTFMSGKQKASFFRKKQAVARFKSSVAREIFDILAE